MHKFTVVGFFALLNSAVAGAEGVSHTVDLQTHAGGTLYVDAVLADSAQVKLLVDTGASMLTVNQKTFRQLRHQTDLFFSHDLGFRTANGKIHKVKVYVLPRLTLGGSCELRDVELAVMSGGKNILGMNVLSQFAPIGLSIQPPRLQLSNCEASLVASHTVMP